jgi:hypothetical protein
MADGPDLSAVSAALQGIQDAFAHAARERLGVIRRLAALEVDRADAPALRTLVEALLHREAADADQATPLPDRVARVAAEVRAAAAARRQLAGAPEVDALVVSLDATWDVALRRSDALAAALQGRPTPEIANAVTDYVGALRALHALDPAASRADIDRAAARFAGTLARLERAVGAPAD